jgi:hypothetical protein
MSPFEHESVAAHTTCPPDDARTLAAHDIDNTRHDSADEHDHDHVVSRQPAPPPAEAHTKPAAADMDAPTRDIPTPMTSTDDGADDQRASQASPVSTTAPAALPLAASQLTWPFPAHRVRRSALHARSILLMPHTVPSKLVLFPAAPRQPFQRQPDIRPPAVRG